MINANLLPDAGPLPERIGHVKITRLIGHGAMGEVYEGHDEELGRKVAIKVLSEQPDEEARGRFDREAQALARLCHPNVVTVYHKGMLRGRPYFTMELVEGPTVADILDSQGPFTVPEAWEIVRQAALGLRAASEAGVTHRDVKPANLLVSREGTVKVADFGVCRISGSAAMTEEGTTLGTPFYMAPEQARGEAVDHRADQYSLGATFFHLVSGTPPFASTQTIAQLLAHQKEPAPDLHQRCPQVPSPVARVVKRMMAKGPEDRYPGYDEMIDAMEDAFNGAPSQGKWRRVALWGGGAVVASALAAVPLIMQRVVPVEPPPPPPAVVRAEPPPPAPTPPVVVEEPAPPPPPAPEELKADRVDRLLLRVHERGEGRANVLTELARTGDPRARDALEAVLKDMNDPEAPLAAVLLGRLGDQHATEALITSLASPRRATVLAAVDALTALRDVRAVVPLQSLAARHEDATVRARAKRAGSLLFAVESEP